MRIFLKLLIIYTMLLITIVFQSNKILVNIKAEDDFLSLNSSACYLIEEKSGHVLYKENEEAKLYPASMTKMMGLLLVCEALKNGSIQLDDMTYISSDASKMGGSQVFLEANEQMSINDLLKCVCIASANDAMYALSEVVASTNENFIKMMNQKAQELKLVNTHFVNVTGFDDENHYTCAKDMALIAKELLIYKDIILPYTSIYDTYIRQESNNPFWLVNTNKLIKYYHGMDGLKTGYTHKAGYNLTSTAKRNGVRLICVVMNEPSIEDRSKDTTTLLNYGFSLLKEKVLFNEGETIKQINFNAFKKDTIPLIVKEDIKIYLYHDENENDISINLNFKQIQYPILQGDEIAILTIITSKNIKFEYPVYAAKDIKQTTYLDILLYNLSIIFK